MNISLENNYPGLCVDVGLSCDSCTAGTARQLATVCKGLHGKLIKQLFVQIHPHVACFRMHAHFAAAYQAASTEQPLAMTAAA